MPKTFFITGVSSGLGRAFAHGALEAGHTVIGTVRKTADLAPFEALDAKAHGRILDVTDHAAVIDDVAEAEASIGPIDVLIANAGYGLEGVFEETPLSEVRAQFETNFFGLPPPCSRCCRTCASDGVGTSWPSLRWAG